MIDTHAHLTDERLASQIGTVLTRAREVGVTKIIAPSTSLEDARLVVEMIGKYDEVYGLVGVHPENISHLLFDVAHLKNELRALTESSGKIVGIGEIGLDFYYDKEKKSKELQMKVFREQLELAVKMDLPVVIHMREAETETTEILSQIERLPKGQFHCFAGSDTFLKLILDKGFYVSFCGNITYKSAGTLREQVKKVPLDRLLLETDSPYLAPEGQRGSLNEPANVKIIGEYIAKLLDVSPETLIKKTTKNAKCLFFGG